MKRTVISTICSQTHPIPGGTQNLGQPKKHFFDTFFQFRPWRGPKCDQNQLWHVNVMGKLQLGKKIGEFWAPGAEIWLFKKKNMDRSIDLAVQHIWQLLSWFSIYSVLVTCHKTNMKELCFYSKCVKCIIISTTTKSKENMSY